MIPIQRVAHRGGALLAPENTLSAFRRAISCPIDAIEIDVQMSRDGVPIVFHDATVERLTDGTGNILDMDFATLRSLNVATHFHNGWPQPEYIPTLHEVLNLVKGQTRVYIEIKLSKRDGIYNRYPQIAETVIAEVQAASMQDQVLIISFDWHILATIKALTPEIETGALISQGWWAVQTESPLQNACDQAMILGCSWVSMDYHLFSSEMVEFIHQRGLSLGLWTVNTINDLRHFSSIGVDAVTSDNPELFAQLS